MVDQMIRNRWCRLLASIAGCVVWIATLGCADDGMVQVAGTVSMNGQPIAQGTIGFIPADMQGATAETVIEDGSYSVRIPRGEKNVVIHGYEKVGERFPWGKDNPPADVLKEIVPKEFNEGSTLTFSANANDSEANFELKSPN